MPNRRSLRRRTGGPGSSSRSAASSDCGTSRCNVVWSDVPASEPTSAESANSDRTPDGVLEESPVWAAEGPPWRAVQCRRSVGRLFALRRALSADGDTSAAETERVHGLRRDRRRFRQVELAGGGEVQRPGERRPSSATDTGARPTRSEPEPPPCGEEHRVSAAFMRPHAALLELGGRGVRY